MHLWLGMGMGWRTHLFRWASACFRLDCRNISVSFALQFRFHRVMVAISSRIQVSLAVPTMAMPPTLYHQDTTNF